MSSKRTIDKPLLAIVVVLVVAGFFAFLSATLGLLVNEGRVTSSFILNQVIGIIGGFILMYICSRVHYKFWKKYAFYIFLASIVITLLVFVPNVGIFHGGARRWISLGFLSFQPAELLKIGFVIYFAAWAASMRRRFHMFKFSTLPFIVLLALVSAVLLLQPDAGTMLVVFVTAFSMYIIAGALWSHLILVGTASAFFLWILSSAVPYINARIMTFISAGSSDPLNSGWQIRQSIIGIGSGEWFGRGFGKSIQKFGFLPEPVGDSIFAVAAEEWGFIGSLFLISLFIALAVRGFHIAARAPDEFSRLLVTGIIVLILSQSFINIAAMINVFPLTGMPLLFISHGGTAMLFALSSIGIVLNVSRHMKK
jgi:cell division protein FtsW